MPRDADIEAGLRSLITLVHNSNSLISALNAWLTVHGVERTGVTHRLIDARTRRLPRHAATKVGLVAGTPALRRRGELWIEPHGTPVRVATANAWVVPQRMPDEAVELIRHVPLGIALQEYGMRRVPCPPRYSRAEARHVVRLAATLVVNGEPWAVTDEILDQAIVGHVCSGNTVPPSSAA